jgi:membrane protein DedA with SNARE-associated domain
MLGVVLVFLVVYVLNLIPAFAPPTWMVFSFLGVRYPSLNLKLLALVGAAAATLGRVTLAKLSRVVIRQKFMSQSSRENIDAIREHLEGRHRLTSGVFLFYAFTPFPSNYLFIAYGLTTLPLRLVAIPFLIGRTISYSFWGFTSSAVARRFFPESSEALSYFSVYFVLSQVLLLFVVYAFTRVDWRALFDERKFKWTAKGGPREKIS